MVRELLKEYMSLLIEKTQKFDMRDFKELTSALRQISYASKSLDKTAQKTYRK